MKRDIPGPGQESVWDYPRPPAVSATNSLIRVIHAGVTIVDTFKAIRVLETSQPPAFYLPPADIQMAHFTRSQSTTMCEWKGRGVYWDLTVNGRTTPDVAWSYLAPTGGFAAITGYLAIYAQKVDACFVDEEQVTPNDGMFYGGWITSKVVGPFKGGPGTLGW